MCFLIYPANNLFFTGLASLPFRDYNPVDKKQRAFDKF